MIHIALHILIPLLVGVLFYRKRWRRAFLIMISTMIVDADHLLANPIYDPLRCSINFHPLHSFTAIGVYVLIFLASIYLKLKANGSPVKRRWELIHFIGLGLLIHMILDAIDCL